MLAYTRAAGGQEVLVAINFGGEACDLDLSALGQAAELLLSTEFTPREQVVLANLALEPHESILLELVGSE